MGAGHDHDHAHGAGAHRSANQKRLAITMGLILAFMVAEIIGGMLTNSLALLADAGHMFSDVAALALSLFALWIAQRPASPTHTYGYYRTEILVSLFNGATLIAVAFYIFVEAYHRFGEPPEVAGGPMMLVALGGLLVNLIGLWLLHGGREESLNMQGAWLHVLSDALGSIGAILAGALIWRLGWNWVDPVISVVIGILVIYSSWSLLQEAVAVLMEGAPGHIDVDEIRNRLRAMPGVESVHDLHIWTVTTGIVALSAHVGVNQECHMSNLLTDIRETLNHDFGINHVTVQLEPVEYEAQAMPV